MLIDWNRWVSCWLGFLHCTKLYEDGGPQNSSSEVLIFYFGCWSYATSEASFIFGWPWHFVQPLVKYEHVEVKIG